MIPARILPLCACFSLAAARETGATVSPGGGAGVFATVQDAIDKAPQNATAPIPWTIRIKPGIYRGRVHVQSDKPHIRLIGENAATTVITYDLYASMKGPDGAEIGTFRTPTAQVDADGFSAEGITFANSAGPVGQALALRVDGDRATFLKCRFTGYQDTILLNRGRQYFKDCTITGAVDFIFGAATAWFEGCTVECNGNGYITAASTPADHSHGFVFSNCAIRMARPGLKVYLGRPWRPNAATLFLRTTMPAGIRPEGWNNWRDPAREKTARYAEIACTGPGASAAARVPWVRIQPVAGASVPTVTEALGGWTP